MPELPEVETVVRGIRRRASGKEVLKVECFYPGTVRDIRDKSTGYGTIEMVDRRGKYILIECSAQVVIMVHLRMTGKLIYEDSGEKESSHCRAQIDFRDGSRLIFDDVRTFGKITIMDKGKEKELLSKLGREPLAEDFTADYLEQKLSKRTVSIKQALLDQKVIAGLGNIYVAEILYRAKVSPLRAAHKIKKREIKEIVKYTQQVLSQAIEKNGTTISDYRSVEDKTGEFQNFLKVYGKEVCDCGEKIKRIKQGGRSTYYCPHCQT